MKHLIRKILKEDTTQRYMDKILSDVERNLKQGRHIDAKKRYAIPPEIITKFEEQAIRKFHSLEGLTINIGDYIDSGVSLGGYYFQFGIEEVIYEGDWEGNTEYTVIVNHIDGTVDLIDGTTEDLPEILMDDDIGWEIATEIQDIISDIVHILIPDIVVSNFLLNVRLDIKMKN